MVTSLTHQKQGTALGWSRYLKTLWTCYSSGNHSRSTRKPDDFILAGRMGVPGDHARMLRDHIKPGCQALGLKPATWLTFRRSWNTWADGQGISPKIRGAIVGNSEEINSRIYTKTIPDTLRRAVESVSEVLYAQPECAQIVRNGSPVVN